MSEDTEGLLTGRAGEEARQGFVPLQHAVPDPDPEPAIDSDSAVAKHLERPAPPEPVERAYHDAQTGKPRDGNETVELERAARDISEARATERLEADRARNEALNRELDDATATLDALRAAEAPQPQAQEPQPDYTPQPDPEHALAVDPNIDPEIAAALQNPKIRAVLEQANQGVEQTKAQFQQATAALALEAQGMITALFPELAGLNGQQMQGALAVMAQNQPERVQQLQQLMGRARNLVGAYQQQQAQTAQQQSELAAARFRQFSTYHDANSLVNETPETLKQIRTTVLEDARQAGISEQDLVQAWNSTPALRHSFVQNLMADGVKFRMAQRGMSQHRANPVPQVIRPGSSAERVTRSEELLSEARAKLKPSMSARQAADYLIARRGANR